MLECSIQKNLKGLKPVNEMCVNVNSNFSIENESGNFSIENESSSSNFYDFNLWRQIFDMVCFWQISYKCH